jgi:hypothetical protein
MATAFPWTDAELQSRVRDAIAAYWRARSGQANRQQKAGVTDTGTRGEVTGGQHLNGFSELLRDIATAAGFTEREIRFRLGVEIPGYYRPTKKWDIVVVRQDRLCAAIEMKSQVGPSFGNNFNNRTEEAVGSSVDLWRAFQEGILGTYQPWLGYFFFLEETTGSTRPIGVAPAAFTPDPVFQGTSYADRYKILCQRMVLERNYTAAALLLSPRASDGTYRSASDDLGFERFARALYGHLIGCA